MLQIAVCDDDTVQAQHAAEMIRTLGAEESIPVNVRLYSSGTELLGDFPKGLDLLFLDIEMPGLSGMETARRIRSFDEELTLVFMTSFAQYAIEGYSVKAYRYLLKPLHYPAFAEELRPALRTLYYKNDPYITVRNDTGMFRVCVSGISYVETTKNKHVLIHTGGSSVLCYQTLSAIEAMLAPYRCFYRCHTSFLINLKSVREILACDVILAGEDRIPVSKHRRKEMLAEYTRFLGRMI